MTKAEVLLLQGNEAQDVWRSLLEKRPEAVRERTLEGVSTYHPGRQALFVRDPEERARRAQHRIDSHQKGNVWLLRLLMGAAGVGSFAVVVGGRASPTGVAARPSPERYSPQSTENRRIRELQKSAIS
ncbi:hypothetical protein [Streptomyces sp. NBC_01546]|uniref:hypothetical protein n=1 Tax=Streptomyces sp. NBC_01546 TaxID=2975872 RepID=UPI00386F8358